MKTYSFSGLRVLKTRVDEGKFHTFIEREPFNFKAGALLYLGLIWPKPLFAAEQGMGFGVLILNKVCYNCHFTRFSVLNTVFVFWTRIQGHPMDLLLKISVLQAHFCWLGDVEEIIVLGRKVLLEKDNSECQRGFEV